LRKSEKRNIEKRIFETLGKKGLECVMDEIDSERKKRNEELILNNYTILLSLIETKLTGDSPLEIPIRKELNNLRYKRGVGLLYGEEEDRISIWNAARLYLRDSEDDISYGMRDLARDFNIAVSNSILSTIDDDAEK